jgi:hypothetical protein
MIFNQSDSPLSGAFFSDANQDYLQNQIQKSVFSTSGYKIGQQNPADVRSLMGVAYTDLRVDTENNIAPQVAAMNENVIAKATRTIINAIKQDLTYLRDITILPVPPKAPQATSTYGTKLTRTYNPFA